MGMTQFRTHELIFRGYFDNFGICNTNQFGHIHANNISIGETVSIRVYSESCNNGYIISGQYAKNGWHIGISRIKSFLYCQDDNINDIYWKCKYQYNSKDGCMNLHLTVPEDVIINII